MDRVEPGFGASDRAAGLPPYATSVSEAAVGHADRAPVFSVRYAVRPRRPGRTATLRHGFGIKGTLSINGDFVTLCRSNGSEPRSFYRSDIFDIEFHGRRIGFDLHVTPQDVQRVTLKTRHVDDVRRIVERLPAQMTPAFAAERVALNTFPQRLVELTPLP
ncbi:hypothetical protein [Paraburkholderia antibiotica]|uniref:Uncharacterized protein n=1 Tax=Paraburkholderia antibiotica TaxID=2728839 RepID=A0A7Y0A244_9BURK|nr:hypothetical protein [Paraburkholderia antibiotica]NML35054.1 hypothetical protein [Paraburkholderia antibiotica]